MRNKYFLIGGNGIDLDKCNFKGCFWTLTNHTYESLSKIDKKEYYNIRWKTSYGYVPLYIRSHNNTIFCKIGKRCIEFTLIKNKYGLQIHLSSLTKKCSINFVPESKISKTQEMLSILDHVAFMFGSNRIYLQDDAYPYTQREIDYSFCLLYTSPSPRD